MRHPLHLTLGMIRHQVRHALARHRRYPFVLMLEPHFTCNLACVGCASERHTGVLEDRLSVAACLRAVDECKAPMVSLCGGEPTLYPELKELVDSLLGRRRHIFLCTNALLLDEKVFGVIPPHRRLTINVHLDGMRETHDRVCARAGVFDRAVDMMKKARRRGYRVLTNTTVYRETKIEEIEDLCRFLSVLGVDGILISPGYEYISADREVFLTREEIQSKFQRILKVSGKYRIQSSPLFLEFAAGMRDYRCSPWSTVTFNPRGWQGPCYLIGQQHFDSFEDFWTGVDWDYWESRQDRRCQNCAMHSGFEASAVRSLPRRPRDMARMAAWSLFG